MSDDMVDADALDAAAAYDEAFADFLRDLERLYVEFGTPSYSQVCRAAKKTRLHKAGITDMLSGKRLPTVDFLIEFVQVLTFLFPDGLGGRSSSDVVGHWRLRWVDLKARQREVQSPLNSIRRATKNMVEASVRSASETERRAVCLRTEAEADAARIRAEAQKVLEDARREADHLLGEVLGWADEKERSVKVQATRIVEIARTQARATEAEKRVEVSGDALFAVLRRMREKVERALHADLPALMRHIAVASGGGSGPRPEFPSVGVRGNEDLERMADCLDQLHRELATLATEQAMLRANAEAVAAALAGRTQKLLGRQLSLLDDSEDGEGDPGRLEALYRIDQLGTRARRFSEVQLLLVGEEPKRASHWAVPLIDVLRASAGEVGSYERVDFAEVACGGVEIDGIAVTGLTHLISELLENATMFSPPQSLVHVVAEVLADGRVRVSIFNQGSGMEPADTEAVNALFADPSPINRSMPSMGLFIVRRIAAHLGIDVEMQCVENGGVKAVVTLPAGMAAGPGAPRI
ncbi:ATP-binding protein [Kitasatospora sp. SC0581]|uniref:ATP-binding protein n=1 Tax=Kitasatospora sp. SC0581 TaxID=3394360 RepID=UPI003A876BFC